MNTLQKISKKNTKIHNFFYLFQQLLIGTFASLYLHTCTPVHLFTTLLLLASPALAPM